MMQYLVDLMIKIGGKKKKSGRSQDILLGGGDGGGLRGSGKKLASFAAKSFGSFWGGRERGDDF